MQNRREGIGEPKALHWPLSLLPNFHFVQFHLTLCVIEPNEGNRVTKLLQQIYILKLFGACLCKAHCITFMCIEIIT